MQHNEYAINSSSMDDTDAELWDSSSKYIERKLNTHKHNVKYVS